MSAVPDRRSANGLWRPVLRFALTVAIYGVLGLIVGAAITIIGYLVLGMHLAFDRFSLTITALTTYGLLLAYPILMAPAVGIVVAIRDRFGGTRLPEAAAIGTVAAILWLLTANSGAQTLFAYLLVISSAVASMISWRATRWLRRFG